MQIALHFFHGPRDDFLVDTATEDFFAHLSFAHYFCSWRHTYMPKYRVYDLRYRGVGLAPHIRKLHFIFFMDLGMVFWLIQLLRIFLRTCLLHTICFVRAPYLYAEV